MSILCAVTESSHPGSYEYDSPTVVVDVRSVKGFFTWATSSMFNLTESGKSSYINYTRIESKLKDYYCFENFYCENEDSLYPMTDNYVTYANPPIDETTHTIPMVVRYNIKDYDSHTQHKS